MLRVVILLILVVSWSTVGQTYTIYTVAGNGTPGLSGDNGPATSAQLLSSIGVAVDSAGNLYIADTGNNRIRKVSNAVITTVAGNGTHETPGLSGDNGPATSAQLNQPVGVAVDSAGNLFIADALNNRIRKVSNGTITTVAGSGAYGILQGGAFSGDNGPATSAQLSYPEGVAVDSAGNAYIADTFNNRIRKVSNGIITTAAGGGSSLGDNGPATNAQLNQPIGVAVDSVGNLYIADTVNQRIRKVSNGLITTVAGNGEGGFGGDNGPATSAQVFDPRGVIVDSAGNLYVADSDNGRIREVSNGVITTVAGNGTFGFSGDGGPATSAGLAPSAVAADSVGDLYIAEASNNRIRFLTSAPTITAVVNAASFQNGPVSPGEVVTLGGAGLGPSNPAGLTLDQDGRVSTQAGGVQVLFSGFAAPLTYVSSTQINAVVPYEIQGLVTPFAQVEYQGRTSNAFSLTPTTTAPALFTSDGSGTGPAAALNQDYSYNAPNNPAPKGSYVVLYMTGEGQTAPPGVTGKVTTVSATPPLTPQPVLPVAVLIGLQPAFVAFYGEAPGLVSGVMQLNVQIPSNVPSGNLQITVFVGGNSSQSGVSVSVR
jgi:uncharacterized protein (TIGR03437 family)